MKDDISIRNIRKDAKLYVKEKENYLRAVEMAWSDEMQRLFKSGSKAFNEIVRRERKPKWIRIFNLKLDIHSGRIKTIKKR